MQLKTFSALLKKNFLLAKKFLEFINFKTIYFKTMTEPENIRCLFIDNNVDKVFPFFNEHLNNKIPLENVNFRQNNLSTSTLNLKINFESIDVNVFKDINYIDDFNRESIITEINRLKRSSEGWFSYLYSNLPYSRFGTKHVIKRSRRKKSVRKSKNAIKRRSRRKKSVTRTSRRSRR